jgi:tRNA threonylcarbamoyladenosine biosynthesis protein TsaE
MNSPLEWQEAGFSEYFDLPGFCLIEWPEKAEGTLPPLDIQIELSAATDDESRDLHFTAHTPQGTDVLATLISPAL